MTNKDLISQYVDTGLELPEYQVSKLPSSALKTYLRKRIMSTKNNYSDTISHFEFSLLDEDSKLYYYIEYPISYFLKKSEDDRKYNTYISNKIIDIKKNKLTSFDVKMLLSEDTFPLDKDSVFKDIFKSEEEFNNPDIVYELIKYSPNKDELIEYYITNRRNKMNSKLLSNFVTLSSKKEDMIYRVLKIAIDVDIIDKDFIIKLLYSTKDVRKLMLYFINSKDTNIKNIINKPKTDIITAFIQVASQADVEYYDIVKYWSENTK